MGVSESTRSASRAPRGGDTPTGEVLSARQTEESHLSFLQDAFSEVLGEESAAALMAAAEDVPYPGEGPEDVETGRQRMVRRISDENLLDY